MITPDLIQRALANLQNFTPSPGAYFTDSNLFVSDFANLIIGGHQAIPVCLRLCNGCIELSMHYSSDLQSSVNPHFVTWVENLKHGWVTPMLEAKDVLSSISLGGKELNYFFPIQLNSLNFKDDNLIDLDVFPDKQVRLSKFKSICLTLKMPLPMFPGNDWRFLSDILGENCFSMSFGQLMLAVFQNPLSNRKIQPGLGLLTLVDSSCPGIDFLSRLFWLFSNSNCDGFLLLEKEGMFFFDKARLPIQPTSLWVLAYSLNFFKNPHLILEDLIDCLAIESCWEVNTVSKEVYMTLQLCLANETFLAYAGKVEKIARVQNTLAQIIRLTEKKKNEQYFWWLNNGTQLVLNQA